VPAGDLREWDGLLAWFVEFLKRNQSHLADKYIRRWHRAALEKIHAVQPVVTADPQQRRFACRLRAAEFWRYPDKRP
jgi:hypothetical protein